MCGSALTLSLPPVSPLYPEGLVGPGSRERLVDSVSCSRQRLSSSSRVLTSWTSASHASAVARAPRRHISPSSWLSCLLANKLRGRAFFQNSRKHTLRHYAHTRSSDWFTLIPIPRDTHCPGGPVISFIRRVYPSPPRSSSRGLLPRTENLFLPPLSHVLSSLAGDDGEFIPRLFTLPWLRPRGCVRRRPPRGQLAAGRRAASPP